jgi:predicted TIM-barrel fold metal-dependent hydrolase
MKIIDSHVHVGLDQFCTKDKTDFNYDLNNDYESFIKIMDKNGINQAVILPIPHSDYDSYLSNDYLISAYNSYPDRFIPFCRIDDKLEENFRRGFKGTKIHFVYEDLEIKNISDSLLFLESIKAPVIIHAMFSNKVQQIKKILDITPNLRIILAHMGRGHIYTDEGIIENANGLKKYNNIFFETSTVGNPLSIKNVSEIIGIDRIVFGSDYPFGKVWFENKKQYNYQEEIELIKTARFKSGGLEKIFHSNINNLIEPIDMIKDVIIRKSNKNDFDQVMALLSNLNDMDKKFLAIEPKISLIKQQIRNERHCFVACVGDRIVAFMRESGRPEGYALLEELVIHPDYRQQGIAYKMLTHFNKIYPKTLAKTNAKNEKMIKLLQRNGYRPDKLKAPRIINWTRCVE